MRPNPTHGPAAPALRRPWRPEERIAASGPKRRGVATLAGKAAVVPIRRGIRLAMTRHVFPSSPGLGSAASIGAGIAPAFAAGMSPGDA